MEPGTPLHPALPPPGANPPPSTSGAASGATSGDPLASALALSEQWLDALAQVAHGVWWMTDAAGACVAGQQGLSGFTGLPVSELAGRGWLSALAPDDRAAASDAASTPTPLAAAWRVIRPGAALEWLTVRVRPIAPTTPDADTRWLWVAGEAAPERADDAPNLYRSIFEQTEQGIMVVSASGEVMRANNAALQLLGLTLAQARGDEPPPPGWRITSEEGASIAEPLRGMAKVAGQEHGAATIWHALADGWAAERWLYISASPLRRDQSGPATQTLIALTDVTTRMRERRAIESVAEQSTGELTELRAALDRMTNAFVVLDYQGRFTFVNARAREQFAPQGEPLLGRPFWEVFPILAGSPMEREFHRVLHDATPGTIETQVDDGLWLEVRTYPAPDGVSVFIRDISKHKRTMAELDAALAGARAARAEAEDRAQQLDAVFEAVSDAMVVFGADGSALRANRAMRRLMTTLGVQLALPMAAADFAALMRRIDQDGDEPRSLAGRPLHRILQGESLTGEQAVDLVIRRSPERNLYLNLSGAPIRGGDGAIVGAVESLRDVTTNREAELERSRTLSLVAHELRTPLTAIKLSLDLSLRRLQRRIPLDPSAFTVALTSCLQLERMVTDLVDASRADNKQMALSLALCDGRELAAQAISEQQATTDREITLETTAAPAPILADAARIRQVLSNLISNAIKYSPPETRVTLRVETREGSALFGVRDEGLGVRPDAIPHLFEAFYRAPDVVSLTGPNVGLGLGLYLCKRIVDLHGGQIGMRNRPEGGSLFWFSIPLAQAPVAGE